MRKATWLVLIVLTLYAALSIGVAFHGHSDSNHADNACKLCRLFHAAIDVSSAPDHIAEFHALGSCETVLALIEPAGSNLFFSQRAPPLA